jgi:hypothetical protein
MKPTNKTQILMGLSSLVVGLLIYLCDRQPDSNTLLWAIGHRAALAGLPSLFGPISGQLPSFIHVFSFTLLTAGLLGCRFRGALAVSLFWLAVNVLFELGQQAGIPAGAGHGLAADRLLGATALDGFFRYGTYDPLDLVALLLGSVFALLVWRVTTERSTPL